MRRKRKKRGGGCLFLLLSLIMLLLAGYYCLPLLTDELYSERSGGDGGKEIVIEGPEEDDEAQEGFDEAQMEALAKEQESSYAYESLGESGQKLYLEIYTVLNHMGADIQISTLDTEEIDHVFKCVMQDHPELFFVEGYTVTRYTAGEETRRITYSGTYTMDRAERDRRASLIEDYVLRCLAGAPVDGSDYDKVKYVYEYLVEHTEYDLNAPDNQNICSVFIGGRTVCQGYAKATQYLLDRLGVFCTLVNGQVKSGEPHVWNLVQVDGVYYHVDTTWGDASYNLDSLEDNPDFDLSKLPTINYDYLCANDNIISQTHIFAPVVPVPPSSSLDSYYYVREGIYFTEVNVEQLKQAFVRARERGDGSVVIKCAGSGVYGQMVDYFIEDRKIFDYTQQSGGISYMEEPDKWTLTFYI